MSLVDLDAELVSAQLAMRDVDRARLSAAGVPRNILSMSIIGIAGILLDEKRAIYQPIDDAPRAYILPVRGTGALWPDHPAPDLIASAGDLVDLVAFHPDDEDEWALRRDLGAWLGAIGVQYLDPPPVPVRRSPIAWLRAGLSGICLLTRDPRERQSLLLNCRRIEAEDEDHRRELRRLLERPYSIPRITIAGRAARKAA